MMEPFGREFDNILTCSICLDIFKNPKCLPCGHTFCEEPCLKKLMNIFRQRIRCPECRTPYNTANKRIKVLSNNTTIKHLLDYRQNLLDNSSKSVKHNFCIECGKECTTEKCLHCENYICEDCQNDHLKILSNIISRHSATVSRSLPELENILENFQKCVSTIQNCEKMMHNEVEKVVNECVVNIIQKGNKLIENINESLAKDMCEIQKMCFNLKQEIQIYSMNCKIAKTHITESNPKELIFSKQVFSDMINFLHNFKGEAKEYEDCVNSNICEQIYRNFKEIGTIYTFSDNLNQEIKSLLSNRSTDHNSTVQDKIEEKRKLFLHKRTSLSRTKEFLKSDVIQGPLSGVISLSDLWNKNALQKLNRSECNIVSENSSSNAVQDLDLLDQHTLRNSYYAGKEKTLKKIENRYLKKPRGINIGCNNTIVITDVESHSVLVFDVTGNLIQRFGCEGSEEGTFKAPSGVAVNRKGQFVVSDTENHRIQVFDSSGRFLFKFGRRGVDVGTFNFPCGITTDSSDYIYVCDTENHRIQVFQPDGKFVRKVGQFGNGPEQLNQPYCISVSNSDKLLVSDYGNHSIKIFDSNGLILNVIGMTGSGDGQFKYPMGISVDESEYIIVADPGNSRVQIFHPDGTFLHKFDIRHDLPYQNLVVMSDGSICVIDYGNNCIKIF